ncbi:MAG: hypothetical protein K6G80_03520 [Treponema sp.]|nr:hypothetical protein [Treponema sp.]
MADTNVSSSTAKAAERDEKAAARHAKFEQLPLPLQLLAGIGILVLIAFGGIGFMYLIDGVLLDLDPIGKLLGLLF